MYFYQLVCFIQYIKSYIYHKGPLRSICCQKNSLLPQYFKDVLYLIGRKNQENDLKANALSSGELTEKMSQCLSKLLTRVHYLYEAPVSKILVQLVHSAHPAPLIVHQLNMNFIKMC